MNYEFNKKSTLCISTALGFVLAAPAFAQTPASTAKGAPEEAVKLEEIVVTGTLIRGTAVVGSQTISVDEQAIQLRDAMRVLFPEAVALVSAARQGFMRE